MEKETVETAEYNEFNVEEPVEEPTEEEEIVETSTAQTRERLKLEQEELRKGSLLYNGEEHYIFYKKEEKWLEVENDNGENEKSKLEGGWYHEPGVTVDPHQIEDTCNWSRIEDIMSWRTAARDGQGFSTVFSPYIELRAKEFVVHPLLQRKLQSCPFWNSLASMTELDQDLVSKARKKARNSYTSLNGKLENEAIRGAAIILLVKAHDIFELLACDMNDKLNKTTKPDDHRADVQTTEEFFMSTQLVVYVKNLLQIAGFTENKGIWEPLDGDAVTRIFGRNALKSGRNPLVKVEYYSKDYLRDYYDNDTTKNEYFFEFADLNTLSDDNIIQCARLELDEDQKGRDGKFLPPWVLRGKIESKRIRPPVDPRVHWYSYVPLKNSSNRTFSIEFRPEYVRPYHDTNIQAGAHIKVRFAWNAMHRGDSPSGESYL